MSKLSQKEIINICVDVAMSYICTECYTDYCTECRKEVCLKKDIMKRISNRERWKKDE